jgi:hypothetical protein
MSPRGCSPIAEHSDVKLTTHLHLVLRLRAALLLLINLHETMLSSFSIGIALPFYLNLHISFKPITKVGENTNVYRLLVGKPEGKKLLGRQRHRWVNNIKMDIAEIGCGGAEWIGLAQDREWRALVNAEMNLWIL